MGLCSFLVFLKFYIFNSLNFLLNNKCVLFLIISWLFSLRDKLHQFLTCKISKLLLIKTDNTVRISYWNTTTSNFHYGRYYYKYITNGQWRHSTASPTERDQSGNTNNVIVVGDTASVRPLVQDQKKVYFILLPLAMWDESCNI